MDVSWSREMLRIARARARARLVLGYVPKGLTDRERALVEARYEKRLSWHECADVLGTSYTSVRRYHDALLDKVAAL